MSLKRQMAEDEGFLGRWSRLKREQPAAPEAKGEEEEPQLPETQALGEEAAPPETPAAEPLPEVETLGAGSDFKPFMNPSVAPEMRTQALRKLWASNPLYNHIDMLDDYCEDYTDAAVCIPGMKTAYKIGRGFLKEIEDIAEDLPEEAEEETQQADAAQADQPEDGKPA